MLNAIILQGRFTKDPELRQTPQGTPVATFTIACDRGGKKGECDFINCVAWRQTAEFLPKYFHKGDMILVEGKLQGRTYPDKETGKNRTVYEVVVNNVNFCGGKREENKPSVDVSADDFEMLNDDSSDLPF